MNENKSLWEQYDEKDKEIREILKNDPAFPPASEEQEDAYIQRQLRRIEHE